MQRLSKWLLSWLRPRGPADTEIDEELRFHLEQRAAELRAAGMTAEEARREALRRFGDLERLRGECLAEQEAAEPPRKGDGLMREFGQDVRYGLRLLGRAPGFTLVAVLTLALGIGANTAIFSVVRGVLLRPLPYGDADGIVTLWENNTRDRLERDDVSPANFLDWQERQEVFSAIASSNPWSLDYTGGAEPETFQAALVSKGFFEILGVRALHGRSFVAEEFEPGKNKVVVLTYGLWQRRFGGDAAILNRTLVLDEEPHVVAGILPPEFELRLHQPAREIFAPQPAAPEWRNHRRATYLNVVARLKPGVSLEQARAAMDRIARQLAAEYPQTNEGIGIQVVPLAEHLVGAVRPALLVLAGAAGFVLLIACANVANLLLARSSGREREFAVRAALGAGRARLIRQLLTESLLLALWGCAGGVLLAHWTTPALLALSPGHVPRLAEIRPDALVLSFAAALALLTAAGVGLAPAAHVASADVQRSLREGPRFSAGTVRGRLRGLLVAGEVALAIVLLVGAGLLIRSFFRLLAVDPGFARDQVISLQAFIWERQTTPERRLAFAREVLARAEGLPGVEAAGLTTALPLLESSATSSLPVTVEGQPAPPAGQELTAIGTVATSGYFRALGIPLLRGRLFTDFDTAQSPRVAVINEAMARRLGLADPVGKKIAVQFRPQAGARDGRGLTTLEVIGVVGSVRHEGLDRAPRPEFFRPHAQVPSGSLIFVVRATGDPRALVPSLKSAIWELTPTQPFYSIATVAELVEGSVAERRFNLLLLGAFAALALALAAVGIYGVISFLTAQRRHEIGIRAALGAQRGDIYRLVIGQGMKLAAAGVALGLAGALAVTRVLKRFLFEVEPGDPATFLGVAVALGVVALLACYIPARRATRVDPVVALRYE